MKPLVSKLPEVTRHGALDIQVCIPEEYTDEQIIEFAERMFPCGTELGWQIRRKGDKALATDPERNPCGARYGFVHVMLDA